MQISVSNHVAEAFRKSVIMSLPKTEIQHGQTHFAKRG